MSNTSIYRLPVWLPNLVTIIRMVAGAFLFVGIFYDRKITGGRMVCFILIAMTDWVDGWLARKTNAHTAWGQLLDPLADKVVLLAAFAWFCYSGNISAWFTIFYFAREIAQTILRIVSFAADKHAQVPTLFSSKLKTAGSYVYGIVLFLEQLFMMRLSGSMSFWLHTFLEVFIILLSYIGLIKPLIHRWHWNLGKK